MKHESKLGLERGCVAETSRSASECRAMLKILDAPKNAQLLRLVGHDTAALRVIANENGLSFLAPSSIP